MIHTLRAGGMSLVGWFIDQKVVPGEKSSASLCKTLELSVLGSLDYSFCGMIHKEYTKHMSSKSNVLQEI